METDSKDKKETEKVNDVADKSKDVDKSKDAEAGKKDEVEKKEVQEPTFEMLPNPARIMKAQV